MDVRAADVDLQPADLRLPVEQRAGFGVFLHGKTADIRHDQLVKDGIQLRKLLRNHLFNTGILQTDRVEHAGGTVRDSRRWVAEAWLQRRSLEGKGAEAVDVVDLGKLIAEAEGSGGRDHGIIQFDSAKSDTQPSHRISSFCSTGPSRQIRLLPVIVLQLQPIQAPKPQPIRFSKLNDPEVTAFAKTALSIGSGPQV